MRPIGYQISPVSHLLLLSVAIGVQSDVAIQSRAGSDRTVETAVSSEISPSTHQPAVYFADDFEGGNLRKHANGWGWATWRNQPWASVRERMPSPFGNAGPRLTVITGWSRRGYTGNSVRVGFINDADSEGHAWAELNFIVGTPNLRHLVISFWIYYPTGAETDSAGRKRGWLGPQFRRGRGTRGYSASENDKLFAVYETYSAPNDYKDGVTPVTGPAYVASTWNNWNQGGPLAGQTVLLVGRKTQQSNRTLSHTNSGGDWDIAGPWDEARLRGSWHKVEIVAHIAGSARSADGYYRVYRDGEIVVQEAGIDNFISGRTWPGHVVENVWKAGYLLGFRNSGIDYPPPQAAYVYVSDVAFSSDRIATPVER